MWFMRNWIDVLKIAGGRKEEGRGCHARNAMKAYGVKRSASVTGFVLAEGTHQTDVCLANLHRYELVSMTQGGGSLRHHLRIARGGGETDVLKIAGGVHWAVTG